MQGHQANGRSARDVSGVDLRRGKMTADPLSGPGIVPFTGEGAPIQGVQQLVQGVTAGPVSDFHACRCSGRTGACGRACRKPRPTS